MEGLEEYQDMDDDFWNSDPSEIYNNMDNTNYGSSDEVFRYIEGYNEKYSVSNYGDVKSLWDVNNNKILKSRSPKGWPKVDLIKYNNERRISIRRAVAYLVAEAFVENPNGFKCIDFIDDDYNNLHFENIEWVVDAYRPQYEIVPYIKVLPPKY